MPLLEGAAFDEIGPALFSLKSKADLAKTADTTLFTSLLRSVTAQQAEAFAALRSSKISVLGSIPGGTDTSFVVTKMEVTVEGALITQFDVTPTVRFEG